MKGIEPNMETKMRIRFSKTDTLRFIGHLDFLRVFQQTIRRSGLPIAYSQGFNPHQIISFALPLPLGMESINDYADITLTAQVSSAEIIERLNAAAPRGLYISAAYLPQGATAAAATMVADYAFNIEMPQSPLERGIAAPALRKSLIGVATLQESVKKILDAETLVIPKKTKSGIKNTDIRPDILAIEFCTENALLLRLSAGSGRFLNPLLVAEQLLATPEKPSSFASQSKKRFRPPGRAARCLAAAPPSGGVPCTSNFSRLELYQTDGKGGIIPL